MSTKHFLTGFFLVAALVFISNTSDAQHRGRHPGPRHGRPPIVRPPLPFPPPPHHIVRQPRARFHCNMSTGYHMRGCNHGHARNYGRAYGRGHQQRHGHGNYGGHHRGYSRR